MATPDELAAQLRDFATSSELDLRKPLSATEIEDVVFAVSKDGFTDAVGITLGDLQGFLAADPMLITVRDEKGWTPLLWAAFHGHAQVACVKRFNDVWFFVEILFRLSGCRSHAEHWW
jgi:hypothetical protein